MEVQQIHSVLVGWYRPLALMPLLIFSLFFLPALASADCSPNGTPGNDTIICTGTDADGVNGRAGNDQFSVVAGASISSPTDGIRDTNGNSTLENYGVISATNDGIELDGTGTKRITNHNTIIAGDEGIDVDGPGNSTIETSGFIQAGDNGINGAGGSDRILNTGIIIAGDNGIGAEGGTDVIINNGVIIASDDGINGGQGADVIFQSGTIIAGGNAIDAGKGDDQVTIVLGTEIIGRLNGGDEIDTLIFQLSGDQPTLDAFNAYIANNGINASTGSLAFGGKTYTWVNFEQLQYLLTLIVTGNEVILAGVGGGLEELCTGPIKAFRLPNGDIEVYSGFDVVMPNGFLVGTIILTDLAQGITRFQDQGAGTFNPNWYVAIERSQNIRYMVVYTQENRFVGRCEF